MKKTTKTRLGIAAAATAVAAGTLVYVQHEEGPTPQLPRASAVWYVSPVGGGTGSDPSSPLTFNAALNSPNTPVRPGDSVWLEPGVYPGCYFSSISGTPTEPIVVQGKPGAVLDGASCTSPEANSGTTVLSISGDDIWFRDFEITDSIADKFNPVYGPNPPNRRPNGINLFGDRVKLINLYLHDTADALGLWGQAADTEIHGVVIARPGWIGPDRGYGNGIYVQNETSIKNITDTFVLDSYDSGVQVYSTAGYAVGIHFNGLIVANSGRPAPDGYNQDANLLIGTEQNPANDIQVTNSVFYHSAGIAGVAVRSGYGVDSQAFTLTNSYLVGGSQALDISRWQQATVTGNQFYATAGSNRNASDILAYVALPGASVTWNNNTYFDQTWPNSDGIRNPFAYNGTTGPDGGQQLSWNSWRTNSGFDAQSSYDSTIPANKTIVQPNKYQPGRSNIVVLNWSRAVSAQVALPGVQSGQTYKVYDANDMRTVIATGVYNGTSITIPTPNELGTFVVTSEGQAGTTTTTTSSTTTTVPGSTTTTVPTTTTTTVPTTTTTKKPKPCRRFLWWCV
jgi:hypothetical protein